MNLHPADTVLRVPPGTAPNYAADNPLLQLLGLIERVRFAAEFEAYVGDEIQYLFPVRQLELYGPAAPFSDLLDPKLQDSKTDFQKQNVRTFLLGDTQLARGYVALGDQLAPFLRLSYRGGPDTVLSRASGHTLGDRIKVYVRVAGRDVGRLLEVPYNPASDRYEIEIWGGAGDARAVLDQKGRAAIERGHIQQRPDLVRGTASDFLRENVGEQYTVRVSSDHAMHPVLPLQIEVAWSDRDERFWDSQGGRNYRFEFGMIVRGWNNYLGAGMSPNPHGGVGFLEYRNLMSNYFQYEDRNELGRQLESWNFNAFREKSPFPRFESFLAVEYMDLHLVKGNAGIGLHRHRDNQEVFFMMQGQGYMVVGDWAEFPSRDRCLEVRKLRPGHFAMLKGGNLHGLMNSTDEDMQLFMFGGYD